jgi:pimeloyl-ACP methyl ester carboxylesterase
MAAHMSIPFYFPGETRVLDDRARASLPGSFIRLPLGWVHYELAGPEDGQPVALVHGFSLPMYTWDPTVPALAAAGLRVLRFDLYGRGFSDRPKCVYDLALFDRQILDLLDGLDLHTPVDLIGLSMGGPVAATFTARHPERVRRLGLFDTAGFSTQNRQDTSLVKLPVLGEIAFAVAGSRILPAGQRDDLYHPERCPEIVSRFYEQMHFTGFKRAILSTLRADALGDITPTFRQVGEQRRPTLLIHGQEDTTFPVEQCARLCELIPTAELHVIPDAGHIAHYEHPEVVNPLLIEFLKKA